MSDTLTPSQRSRCMAAIRSTNTSPELIVRRLVHRMGYRFRLHRRDLPGRPDIVFPSRRKVIFVNGCFWHAHGCRIGRPPKSRLEFWEPKLALTRSRDRRNKAKLRSRGWATLTVWQCHTRSPNRLEGRLCSFLGPPGEFPIDMPSKTR